MKLVDHTQASLARYVVAQINAIVPDGRAESFHAVVEKCLDEALTRAVRCIDGVRWWKPGEFNTLHSSQHCIFLYFLANTIARRTGDTAAATRLFLVNKALNGIDLFYEIEMPNVFFIGHSVGIVLAKATYGEHLVLYQNSTVGKSGGVAPVVGDRVVVHPNCAIIGRSRVADGTILAQGTSVINRDTRPGKIAFNGAGGALSFADAKVDIIGDIFRL